MSIQIICNIKDGDTVVLCKNGFESSADTNEDTVVKIGQSEREVALFLL